jgi:hypothetical protein
MAIFTIRPARVARPHQVLRRTVGFTTFFDTAQISALQKKIDELSRVRDQTQARIAFLEGPPEQPRATAQTPPPTNASRSLAPRSARRTCR